MLLAVAISCIVAARRRARRQPPCGRLWGCRTSAAPRRFTPGPWRKPYVEGVAAKQCEPSGDPCYPGGSRQLLFVDRDFQRSWFTKYECEVKSERTSNAFEACAGSVGASSTAVHLRAASAGNVGWHGARVLRRARQSPRGHRQHRPSRRRHCADYAGHRGHDRRESDQSEGGSGRRGGGEEPQACCDEHVLQISVRAQAAARRIRSTGG
jgi:hypothetical protein